MWRVRCIYSPSCNKRAEMTIGGACPYGGRPRRQRFAQRARRMKAYGGVACWTASGVMKMSASAHAYVRGNTVQFYEWGGECAGARQGATRAVCVDLRRLPHGEPGADCEP